MGLDLASRGVWVVLCEALLRSVTFSFVVKRLWSGFDQLSLSSFDHIRSAPDIEVDLPTKLPILRMLQKIHPALA